jgi:prepilin-type processing-associated H-X9-DG protein
MEPTVPAPRGLRFIDLLVAVAMIVVVAALGLPWIHQARDKARRTQCANHLKAIGLAMHAYHEKHRVFPPGITSQSVRADGTPFTASPPGANGARYVAATDGRCPHPNLSQASAFTLILPFLNEHRVAERYNMALAGCSIANSTPIATTIDGYLCPSNPRGSQLIPAGYHPGPTAPLDYALNAGNNGLLTTTTFWALGSSYANMFPGPLRPGAGPFGVNSGNSLRGFRDGRSLTFLLGEAAGGIPAASPLHDFNEKTVRGTAVFNPGIIVDTPWAQGYIPWSDGTRVAGGLGSVFGHTAFDAWYSIQGLLAAPGPDPAGFTPIPLNLGKGPEGSFRWTRGTAMSRDLPFGIQRTGGKFIPFTSKPLRVLTGISVSGFRSYHVAGANFLMADGSVDFISDRIDPRVYAALSSFHGREVFDPDE